MIKAGEDILDSDFILVTTAGEALSARDAVYISTSDGKAYKCDADDLTKMDFAGFAQEAAALNASVNIINHGVATGFSGLTTGSTYFISGTAGAITLTAPTNKTIVGKAFSATVMEIRKLTIRKVYFTGSGTWTKRPGLNFAFVQTIGGGGAGGGASGDGSAGGGGGGGGYSEETIAVGALGATETVTIGAGGTGVSAATGNAGGTTSFGSLLQSTGGAGGIFEGAGGQGGVGSGGDLNSYGDWGGLSTGSSTVEGWGGDGGGSMYGGGGSGGKTGNGNAGDVYGGGGGGAGRSSGGSSTGGAGAAGLVIVTEYY